MTDHQREIEDLEADIQWTEKAIIEDEERLAYLTGEDYKPEENADDEFREKDIEELYTQISCYRRDIATYQRKIERLKRNQQGTPPIPEGGLSDNDVIPF